MDKIAVALSVYKNDSVKYLRQAVNSILNQTVRGFDLFIQVDGSVELDMEETLKLYNKLDNVFVFFHTDNLGLATRLNNTIDHIIDNNLYRYFARMDADDISREDRFDCQLLFLKKNTDVGIVGSDVIEINEIGHDVFYKKMQALHSQLVTNIIKRCPVNHPSVMIDLNVFRKTGLRYDCRLKNTQDYYLWIDFIAAGVVFANINEPLLKFRVDSNFHSRRGVKKAVNDLKSRLYAFNKLDVLTISNMLHTFSLFILRLSPSYIKKLAYRKLR